MNNKYDDNHISIIIENNNIHIDNFMKCGLDLNGAKSIIAGMDTDNNTNFDANLRSMLTAYGPSVDYSCVQKCITKVKTSTSAEAKEINIHLAPSTDTITEAKETNIHSTSRCVNVIDRTSDTSNDQIKYIIIGVVVVVIITWLVIIHMKKQDYYL